MKIRMSILAATAGIMLAACSGMALPGHNSSKPSGSTAVKQALPKANSRSAIYLSVGTIQSIDNDRLVLSHKGKNAKTEEVTFMLNSKTERKGDLTAGEQVSVHYRKENKELMATAVQAMPVRAAGAAKPPVKNQDTNQKR